MPRNSILRVASVATTLQTRNLLYPSLLGLALSVAFATAMAVVPTETRVPQETVIERLDLGDTSILNTKDETFFVEATIERGDSLQQLLGRLNIDEQEAIDFIRNSTSTSPLREEFIAGRSISARSSGNGKLLELHYPLGDRETVLHVVRQGDTFRGETVAYRPETHVTTKAAEIEYSLFGATDSANIPDSVAIQLAEIFGSEIDFHRDIRSGDRLIVSYEMNYLRGTPAQSGRVLAAEFVNDGKKHRAVWFEEAPGKGMYLTPEGKSLKKAFLRSPLKFSRVSSGFSRRFHPLLKKWRDHKGVDYAAPTGTPIRATGNAQVVFAGKKGGYGNVVILRHDNRYSTLYAHMSRFAKGLRRGARVEQGDTIGYVGKTGWATGPHLHYEFRINNRPVNPLSAKLPVATPALSTAQKIDFERQKTSRLAALELMRDTRIAYLE